jgi:hypothetical protein
MVNKSVIAAAAAAAAALLPGCSNVASGSPLASAQPPMREVPASEISTTATSTLTPPVGIGSGTVLRFEDGAGCRLGWVMPDGLGGVVGLTAGHCGPPSTGVGGPVTVDGVVIGTADYSQTNRTYGDVAEIRFDPILDVPVSPVAGVITAAEMGKLPDGTPVCTLRGCAPLRASGRNYATTWFDREVIIDGDSGGPVWLTDVQGRPVIAGTVDETQGRFFDLALASPGELP